MGANAQRAKHTYAIFTTAVQTIKTAVNPTFTVYLITTMYAKNTAWANMRPTGNSQRQPVITVQSHLTIQRVADNSDKQHLTVPLVMFCVDV